MTLPLRIAFGDYDRTRPLVDGRVPLRGIDAAYTLDDIAQFCVRPVYEEFDVAEMSFSWYVMARGRGEPVIALPIFPLRMPVLSYIFCRADAPYRQPSDLIGKRVATIGYRFTVNLWLRGILADRYGVTPQQLRWITCMANEGAGFVAPADIDITVMDGADPEALLLDGTADAVLSPEILPGVLDGNPALRRLFEDPYAEFASYYRATGIVPITHVMVAGEQLLAREPWIAESLLDGFRAAQSVVDQSYLQPKTLSIPGVDRLLEAQRTLVGPTLYRHGVAENRHVITTFCRYALEQGYIEAPPDVDALVHRIAAHA
jgi:4,5-dihydroxyphthalate decarboxylase